MKRIVVYETGTGFTEKYAEWIADKLGCDKVLRKNLKVSELSNYDQIVYGGWIMAGMIKGYNKIKELNHKNVVVFGVGMTKPNEELRHTIAENNGISSEKFFYFPGGYNPKRLGFFKKFILNMIKKSILKKEEKTEEDLYALAVYDGADNTDISYVVELVNQIK